MNKGTRLLDRRTFLRAAAGGTGMLLLVACGGSANQANTGGTSNNGTTKTTSNNTGGNGTGGGKTPEQLNFQGPPTEVATKAQSGGTTPNTALSTGGGQTAVATQGPQATVEVPSSFKEAPTLTQQVNGGKLPKVTERLPKNPMVLQPVDKIGTYGGQWNTVLQGTADSPWLGRTVGEERLVEWKPDTLNFTQDDVTPALAESFEVDKNGTEYVFKLREGIKWSDGKPFTADDIMFWYQDVYLNQELTPAQPTWLNSGDKPVKVLKQDERTVAFQFQVPNGLLLQNIAYVGSSFTSYPAHYMKQFHKKYNPKVAQEAKKQKLDDWQALFGQMADATANPKKPVLNAWRYTSALGESTTQFVAERNPYYWKVDTEGNQLPYLDRVVYKMVEKPDVMVLMGLNGELDMQDRHINELSNKSLFFKNQEKGNYHLFTEVSSSMNTMLLELNLTTRNKNLHKAFNDKNFRIGLSHAINRQEIIDVVYVSQGEPWQSAPRPESSFYNEKLAKQYTEHDLNKANEYLDKVLPKKDSSGKRLGPDGKPMVFSIETTDFSPEWVDVLNIVKKHWSQVGITINIKNENRDIYYTRVGGNEVDASVWMGEGGLEVVLAGKTYLPMHTNGSRFAIPWATWYYNPKAKGAIKPPPAARKQLKLYDQLQTTADAKKQAELMKQILDIAQQQFWCMGISLPINGYGIVKNTFHNVPEKFVQANTLHTPAQTNPPQYWTEEK